jgi:hypothetical protein
MVHIVFILWGLLCPGPTFPPVIDPRVGVVVTLDDDEDSGDETGHIPPVPPIPPPPRP